MGVENFYVPDASGGKRQSVYACKTTDMSADDHVSLGDSEYAGWSDLPAETDEGSNVASADVAKNDGIVVDGHASKPVMQPPIPVRKKRWHSWRSGRSVFFWVCF